MKNIALVISIIIGVAIFLAIVAIATLRYETVNKKMRFQKENPNEWLFNDFYLKVYSAFFGLEDPDVIAVRIGIKIEKYYKTCALVKEKPNTKKLIVNHLYGFAILAVSALFGVLWNYIALLFGIVLFLGLVFFEQHRLDKKAEEMRIQVSNELPRFLDLLQTELKVGLPIETAIYILSTKFDSLLSTEFLEALNEMNLGATGWQQALEKVASKYDVETLSNFVLDVTTSYGKGVSIAHSVAVKAKDIKETHLLNIKERAGKTTNTILIPIAIFQFVPLLAFLLIPALVQVVGDF